MSRPGCALLILGAGEAQGWRLEGWDLEQPSAGPQIPRVKLETSAGTGEQVCVTFRAAKRRERNGQRQKAGGSARPHPAGATPTTVAGAVLPARESASTLAWPW